MKRQIDCEFASFALHGLDRTVSHRHCRLAHVECGVQVKWYLRDLAVVDEQGYLWSMIGCNRVRVDQGHDDFISWSVPGVSGRVGQCANAFDSRQK